ncbi:ribulose-phosphate 3-epimerase [Melghirimyces profundicolus]|uniref:Ribulose-phosphate 3-epimerase n=1 Tax=Melghirimyces profundicolus TaxID=1242148 RepID=A0A2T6BYT5_9BACL|nr:ribulose-phosphate 3-epimerase [Melghirimyces profundicolus]PTX61229.1 ribulose-phosphate 3-epimerase [Melghirimyces profundicolus]
MVKIAPSILSADFGRLSEEISEVEQAGADWVHVDVMDGRFVPNITIGPLVVEAIRPHTRLPLDVHLMIEEPDRYISAFAEAGADWISVHQEACPHLHRTVHLIKEHGVRAGVVLNPATPAETLKPILPDLDLILLMTVNPGFGGQAFIPGVLDKIRQVREMLDAAGLSGVELEVDGGINPETAKETVEAGATVLVAGSAVFGKTDRAGALQSLRTGAGNDPA